MRSRGVETHVTAWPSNRLNSALRMQQIRTEAALADAKVQIDVDKNGSNYIAFDYISGSLHCGKCGNVYKQVVVKYHIT